MEREKEFTKRYSGTNFMFLIEIYFQKQLVGYSAWKFAFRNSKCPILDSYADLSCQTKYNKILSMHSSECKNLLISACNPINFHNCHVTNGYDSSSTISKNE